LSKNGELKNMAGSYSQKDKAVVFSTNHFSYFIVSLNTIKFNDVDETNWAKDYIYSLASKGILSGMKENLFDPKTYVTRSQFSTMLANALKFEIQNIGSVFEDVEDKDWYKPFVMSAYNKGIIAGYKGKFRPKDNVTREEMAIIVARTLENVLGYKKISYNESKLANIFKDTNKIHDYSRDSVYTVYKMKIMGGRENNSFFPNENAKRQEASVVIYKLLQIMYNLE
jgi:hypothetical protein